MEGCSKEILFILLGKVFFSHEVPVHSKRADAMPHRLVTLCVSRRSLLLAGYSPEEPASPSTSYEKGSYKNTWLKIQMLNFC